MNGDNQLRVKAKVEMQGYSFMESNDPAAVFSD